MPKLSICYVGLKEAYLLLSVLCQLYFFFQHRKKKLYFHRVNMLLSCNRYRFPLFIVFPCILQFTNSIALTRKIVQIVSLPTEVLFCVMSFYIVKRQLAPIFRYILISIRSAYVRTKLGQLSTDLIENFFFTELYRDKYESVGYFFSAFPPCRHAIKSFP